MVKPMVSDPLADAHHVLRWTRTVYTVAEMGSPFVLRAEGHPYTTTFYAVVSGRCVFDMSGIRPRDLTSGNFVLLPGGGEASLTSASGPHQKSSNKNRIDKLKENVFYVRQFGDGEKTKIISCTVQFEHPAAQKLLQQMAPVVHFDVAQSEHSNCIFKTLELIAGLISDIKPGAYMLITHLADALLLETIRAVILRSPNAQAAWLASSQDRQVGIAVGLIHDAPERNWSLVSLANAAGMSRSAFAERFAEVVGETPIRYLTQLRMNLALKMLTGGDVSIGVIAYRLGYSSEASFSRAFRRWIGVPPSSVRRPAAKPLDWGKR